MTRTRRKKMNNSPEIMTEEQVYETVTLEASRPIQLDKAENTLILTHVNPDGDCIGSAFALRDIILALGKDASVANPSVMPKRLKFLSCQTGEDCPEDGEVPHMSETDEESLSRFDRIISVDVASPIQLDKNAFLIPQISLMIDHHGMGEPFAKNYIDPCASAAGEIVSRDVRVPQKHWETKLRTRRREKNVCRDSLRYGQLQVLKHNKKDPPHSRGAS